MRIQEYKAKQNPNQIIKLGKQYNNVSFLGERKNQTENLRRTLTEIEYAKEREDRLKKDLEVNMYIEMDKMYLPLKRINSIYHKYISKCLYLVDDTCLF